MRIGAVIGWIGCLALGALAPAPADAAGASPALERIATIDLPGPPGRRLDYPELDPAGGRLFLAHLGAGQVYVLALATGAVTATIEGLPGVEDTAFVADGDRLFASDWGENAIAVVDVADGRVRKRLPTESKPDGIEYAAPFRKVYVSNETGRAVSAIDVDGETIAAVHRFDSETGMPRYDPVARKVYVNLQDRNALAVIDPASEKVEAVLPVEGCDGNHGMALDAASGRAFLACEGNDMLVVFDVAGARTVARIALPPGADYIDFDPGLGRLYAPCSSGAMAVIEKIDAEHYRKVEDVPIPRRAHTAAVDPATHLVYVPLEWDASSPVARLAVYAPPAVR